MKKTFSLNETLLDTKIGIFEGNNTVSLTDSSLWTPILTHAQYGMCYSLSGFQHIGSNTYSEGVYIKLNPQLTYVAIVHLYFMMITYNPSTMLSIHEPIWNEGQLTGMCLQQYTRSRMDRPNRPCNPDPDYKYLLCLQARFNIVVRSD